MPTRRDEGDCRLGARKAAVGKRLGLRDVEGGADVVVGSGTNGCWSISSRRSRHTDWKPPCSQQSLPEYPELSLANFLRRPRILDESGSDAESASYTTIWADVFQPRNREREEEEESIDASLSKENKGRFRSVEGTDNDNALGRRALLNWAWGRMSMNKTEGVLTRPASSLC